MPVLGALGGASVATFGFGKSVSGVLGGSGPAGAYLNYPALYQTVSPFTGAAANPLTATVIDSSTPYPVINYNGSLWLLAYQFGTDTARFGGLRRFTSATANLTFPNNLIPTQSAPVQTDWANSTENGPYSFAGYKDSLSDGPGNMYNVHPYLVSMSNRTASSSTRVWIPGTASQTLIVFADFYRSDSGASGSSRPTIVGRSWGGGNFTTDMVASWRGSVLAGTSYGLDSNLSNGDMCITNNTNPGQDMMLYVLEAGYTISTIGFVMFKPAGGATPAP